MSLEAQALIVSAQWQLFYLFTANQKGCITISFPLHIMNSATQPVLGSYISKMFKSNYENFGKRYCLTEIHLFHSVGDLYYKIFWFIKYRSLHFKQTVKEKL
jgi:hypothetical protein